MKSKESADERRRRYIGRMMPWLPVLTVVIRVFGPAIDLYVRLFRPQQHRYYALTKLAWRAYAEGRDSEAETLCHEVLDLAERVPRDWNYGNAVHDGNQILGLVSLRRGDVESAKAFLLAAGATPGSPQLDSFGPEMVLARELLVRGESGVVLSYLDLVAGFWTKHKPYLREQPWHHKLKRETQKRIGRWKAEIHARKVPTGDNWEAKPWERRPRRRW